MTTIAATPKDMFLVRRLRGWIHSRLKDLKKDMRWALRNRWNGLRIRFEIGLRKKPIANLERYERSIYSQNGEDGILQAIFTAIGTTNKYFVEFGAGSGRQCNSAYFARKLGWRGLWMDGRKVASRGPVPVHQEFITAENINDLFRKHGVPRNFDLLSIDIDGNDFWVWKAITEFHPQVVVIEYNASVPPTQSRTIAYDPHFCWPRTDYFGASLLALQKLGREKGYTLVGCDSEGVNAFFVRDSLAAGRFVRSDIERLYRAPKYGKDGAGHPHDPKRTMIEV